MHGTMRGFEYIILLYKEIDRYDIIPDIMKECRHTIGCRRSYGNDFEYGIVVFSQRETDDRMIQTQYYKNREDSWFASNVEKIVKLSDDDVRNFKFNEYEQSIIERVLSHPTIVGNIKEHGIYDVVVRY